MSSLHRALFAASATLAVLAAAPAAWAQNAYDFNLPAQSLADSLRAVGRQTGVNVAFAPSVVAGHRAVALRGAYSPQDALGRLVAGSGLELKRSGANTFLIEPAGPQDNSQVETDRPTALEEVVVTAEKRAANIQDVPVSVSAVSGARLTSLGAHRLSDYSQYVPGLVVADSGTPGYATVTLCGIAPIGTGSMVGYYIDDTPLGSSSNFAAAAAFPLDLMPYDVDQFEVLRGPQGTLYGAGAMGGLIKYMLKPADTERFSGQVGGEVNYTDHSAGLGSVERAAINIPLIEGKLAIRASAYDQQYQGYTDNIRLGEGDSNGGYQRGGRVAITFKPTDTFKVSLNALISRSSFDDNANVRLGNVTSHVEDGVTVYSGAPVVGSLSHADPYDQTFAKDIDYYSGAINWDLGPLTAISATSYSRTRSRQSFDASQTFGVYPVAFGLAPGVSQGILNLGLDKFTQEFRLVSPIGGKVEWLAGAFYTHESSTNYQLITVLDANYQPISGPFAAYFNPFFASVSLPASYEEYAAFGDLTFHLTERFDVTGGLRYAHNDQKTDQVNQGLAIGGFTDTPGGSSESVATWQANARYRFTDQVMAYGRVATGYRPGGPNGSLGAKIPSVDSDRLTSYEAGIKSTFLDDRALLNISVFDIQWKGIQLGVRDAACSCSYLANGGDAYSRGLELEGSFAPLDGLRIGYNAAYTKSALTSLLPGAPTYLLGYQLPHVPKFTGGATIDYGWALRGEWRASVGGGVHYVGEEWASAPGVGITIKNPSYATADLRAGVSNERLSINLFARNLTDKLVYLEPSAKQNPFTGAITSIGATPLQPRIIGVSIDARF